MAPRWLQDGSKKCHMRTQENETAYEPEREPSREPNRPEL